jgi:hypothetical protein
VAVLCFGGAITGVVVWMNNAHQVPITPHCTAATSAGTFTLDPEQTANAALIAGIAEQRGLPPRAVTIALATAMQESKLRNLDYGDRDSLGLFQQRPSQGWGTAAQIMDPVHATKKFYSALTKIPGYETMDIGAAAQEVQRSGYPSAYAAHVAAARSFASALTGNSPAALTCQLKETTGPGGATASVKTRAKRDLGTFAAVTVTSAATGSQTAADAAGQVTLEAAGQAGGWAVAAWAVAAASDLKVDRVELAGWTWTRADAAWVKDTDPSATAAKWPAGQVMVTLATAR